MIIVLQIRVEDRASINIGLDDDKTMPAGFTASILYKNILLQRYGVTIKTKKGKTATKKGLLLDKLSRHEKC